MVFTEDFESDGTQWCHLVHVASPSNKVKLDYCCWKFAWNDEGCYDSLTLQFDRVIILSFSFTHFPIHFLWHITYATESTCESNEWGKLLHCLLIHLEKCSRPEIFVLCFNRIQGYLSISIAHHVKFEHFFYLWWINNALAGILYLNIQRI